MEFVIVETLFDDWSLPIKDGVNKQGIHMFPWRENNNEYRFLVLCTSNSYGLMSLALLAWREKKFGIRCNLTYFI